MPTKVFNTRTVPSNQTVVDDKLKPTSELQILVGGPYTDPSGEEHKFGHVALRIRSPKFGATYDFGRYGKITGAFGQSGEGILRVWYEFQPYINGEIALNRKTTGFVYPVFDHEADAAFNYFNNLIEAGTMIKGKSSSVKTTYKLAFGYYATGPNCTTMSMDGAKKALPKIEIGAEKFNKPEKVLGFGERTALGASGGATRLFLPANLLDFLQHGCLIKADRTDIHGKGK
jgi:hypothetical protein